MSLAPDSDAAPVTDHIHYTSWSANLEAPQHAEDRELVVAQAVEAVTFTASGTFVNLVTHANHGHPSGYLFEELDAVFGDDIITGYVDQCGCGGHVTRVVVK
ncbi:CGCGG family putative rSAM-modified RiPP protein [Haloarchaeobius amylolyticus]|uniref:CGCGG family putative rSAM-modified RiPP protein n=1 Tax=Haloarchaeobius amylolyticus TaxID=1198296 RepID=UPI002271D6B7|nr:CGCGG family rSAM-modified RiPP protein [Haloarchaeobius amylolyticus]